ncbi:MAG: DNA translocase FtsK [Candidatus Moraniibacteriota bacterium]
MKKNPFALIIGGKKGISPEKMHEYVKKILEAEGISFFEFNYDVLFNDLPERDVEYGENDLYEAAKQLVIREQHASAAFLQSRLRIGYTKGSRLMDKLVDEGIVSESKGSTPREVFYEITKNGGIRKKRRI